MYFGSVRFFRHLIIAFIAVIVLLPIFFAIFYGIKYSSIRKELSQLNEVVSSYNAVEPEELKAELQKLHDSLSAQIAELKRELGVSIDNQPPIIGQNFSKTIDEKLTEFQLLITNPLIQQLDNLQQQVDYSLAYQASSIQTRLNNELEVREMLDDLLCMQQSIEQQLQYIQSIVDVENNVP